MFCPKCGNKMGEGARFCKTLRMGKKQAVTAGIAAAVIVTAAVLLLVFTVRAGASCTGARLFWGHGLYCRIEESEDF